MTRSAVASKSRFQPTLPARGATSSTQYSKPCFWYFNPRSPHGERHFNGFCTGLYPFDFNPRSPHGERRHQLPVFLPQTISTHAPRTGSDRAEHVAKALGLISTHAPRTGSDAGRGHIAEPLPISTHAPRTGSDPAGEHLPRCNAYFNPRSPHGERQCRTWIIPAAKSTISTHAPRTGSDERKEASAGANRHFNPRSPHGERRSPTTAIPIRPPISTHAPRTGSDDVSQEGTTRVKRFQPTLPARGATPSLYAPMDTCPFQPTLPARGATLRKRRCATTTSFQPTLPARGATRYSAGVASYPGHFNPRSPHGERRPLHWQRCIDMAISTHAPRTGSDQQMNDQYDAEYEFQPTLPARGATFIELS